MSNFIIGIVVVLVILIAWTIHKRTTTPSLYTRLGGVYSISAVVNHFSDALIENPIVGKNSQNLFLRDWSRNQLSRLPGLKFMRTLWLCAVAGGPYTYTPTVSGKCPFSLENAHSKLNISPAEFDAVAIELSNSLDHFNVPPQEKSEVLSAFSAHKSEINMNYLTNAGMAPTIMC
jgi:hemoglobin